MDTLNLKNYQLNTLTKAIDFSMSFAKSRVKNRFLTILAPKLQAIEKSRLEILNELCDKDKDGKPVMNKEGFQLSDKNRKKWDEEYNKLMMEECIIDVTPSLKADLGTIKDILNTSTVEVSTQQTVILEEVMTSLEITKPKKLPEAKKK
jgi:hypothetical protein